MVLVYVAPTPNPIPGPSTSLHKVRFLSILFLFMSIYMIWIFCNLGLSNQVQVAWSSLILYVPRASGPAFVCEEQGNTHKGTLEKKL